MCCSKQEFIKSSLGCFIIIGVIIQGHCVTFSPYTAKTSKEITNHETNKVPPTNETNQHKNSSEKHPHELEQQTSDTILPAFFKPAYVSPFSKPQFKQQLLPLIGENIKQKVKEFVEDVDDGLEFLANVFSAKEMFAKQALKKVPFIGGFKPVAANFNPGSGFNNNFPNMQPTVHTTIKIYTKKPYYRYASDGTIAELCSKFNCSKPNKIGENDIFLKEAGIDKYKKFEENVLRNLEEIEEKKVEATIGSFLPSSSHLKHSKEIKKESLQQAKKVKPYGPTYTSIIGSSDAALESHFENTKSPLKKIKKLVKKPKPTRNTYSPISGALLFNNDYGSKQNLQPDTEGKNKKEKENFLYKHEEYYGDASDQSTAGDSKSPTWKASDSSSESKTRDHSKVHHRFKSSNRSHLHQESKITKTFALPKTRPSTTTSTKAPILTAAESKIKSTFVDKVKESGKRGSIKFNPKNLNF